uniref:Phorbol-ester/DAG-type domain-containing protein n=1 Tax=Macrostomum lignano TaxID=282301 RepID=A0A1I8JNS2_9PLAT
HGSLLQHQYLQGNATTPPVFLQLRTCWCLRFGPCEFEISAFCRCRVALHLTCSKSTNGHADRPGKSLVAQKSGA